MNVGARGNVINRLHTTTLFLSPPRNVALHELRGSRAPGGRGAARACRRDTNGPIGTFSVSKLHGIISDRLQIHRAPFCLGLGLRTKRRRRGFYVQGRTLCVREVCTKANSHDKVFVSLPVARAPFCYCNKTPMNEPLLTTAQAVPVSVH